MALTTTIETRINALQTGSSGLASVEAKPGITYAKSLTSGTASGQADVVWAKTNTLAASANEDLDLSGSLPSALGGSAVFAKVKAIQVTADEGNTNNVVVGGAAATQFVGGFGAATHTFAVPPGGSFMVTAPAAGWTVGAGASDLLRIANSGAGTSVTYKIMVVGTSA
jgi:hypothetical protein